MKSSNSSAMSISISSRLKAYWIPLILFSGALFFQLFVIPNSFPPSHYDVLGVKRYCSIEEVRDAYEKLSSMWDSGLETPDTTDFIKTRYAFELLTNPLWKRDYDVFDIDENLDVIETLIGKYEGKRSNEIELPLLKTASSDFGDNAFSSITYKKVHNLLEDTSKASLVQVYSMGSKRCAEFSIIWKRIVDMLDGMASSGVVDIGDMQLAMYLAEKKPAGKPFFRNGIPSLITFPPGCKTSDCLVRYNGELSADAVIDWFSTTILGLPRIFYYSKESLGSNFLAKSGSHKIKVIIFSKTGERANPFVRQSAKEFSDYASFAYVLWRQEDFSVWWNTFEVESAPAVVLLKDPGLKPVVHQGPFDDSSLLKIVEQNKHHVLPQLRTVTSMELGCDPRGFSRAGSDTTVWYCVILAGRLSTELNKMRETMRRIQDILSSGDVSNGADNDKESAISATAYKQKRLTFVWLDGEVQKAYCFFYLQSEYSYETCGPRKDMNDVPQLFIIRYKRNATEDTIKVERKPKTIFDTFNDEEVDPSSQLVARYNGSAEIEHIVQWISGIVKDGDFRDLPFFRTKTPELVPEDVDPVWKRGAQNIGFTSKGLKQRIGSIVYSIHDRQQDPRIGPFLLLAALMSFGSIWLRRSQATRPSRSNHPTQTGTEGEARPKRRNRPKPSSNKDKVPSFTDTEP